MESKNTLKICVLKLENYKWYIERSTNVTRSFQEHRAGKGVAWTKIYKPIKIEKVVRETQSSDEDRIVKEYMANYGIDNVRGGSYCQESLDDFQRESIQRELWMQDGACFICGRKEHTSEQCKEVYDINGSLIGETLTVWLNCPVCNKQFSIYRDEKSSHPLICEKCHPPVEPEIKSPVRRYVLERNSRSDVGLSDSDALSSPRSISEDTDSF